MINQNPKIELTHQNVKHEILALKGQTLSAWILNYLGKFFGSKTLGYWLSNIVLLNLIVLSPLALVAIPMQEIEKANRVFRESIVAVEIIILGLVAAHIATQTMLDDIANHIVRRIINTDDLSQILTWLRSTLSKQSWIAFALPFCIIWALLSVGITSFFLKQFVGFGFTLTYIITGFLAGTTLYIPLWTNSMIVKLKDYQYEMNTFSPAESEILNNISEMQTKSTYFQVAVISIITLVSTSSLVNQQFRVSFALPILAFAWFAIIAQFLLTRSTLGTITNRTKWITLNKIQTKINFLESNNDLSDKDTVERLLRLVDIHKQVMASRINTFDLKSFSTLFSQLMLPLLGLLLGNLDKVFGLLGK